MKEDKRDDQPQVSNVISDQTGQFDARFILWRAFCAENNVPVETLPSQLKGETKEKWEKIKNRQLHRKKQ